jgi:hypothetical protein
MYQQYPGGVQPNQPNQPVSGPAAPPQSVVQAARVMYAGAAASLVGIVIDFLLRHSIRTAIIQHDSKLTAAQVNDTYHAELVVFVIVGVIGAGLWFWMARSCLAGKSWARITSTVFFAIATIDALVNAAMANGGSVRFYGFVVWIIGLIAVIFLWQRSSSDYFRGAPRY